MYRLIEFIRSTYVVLLFILAEVVAVSHYAWSSGYARAKIFVVTNSVVGGVSKSMHNTAHLFSLPSENRELVERIAQLESELSQFKNNASHDLSAEAITYSDPQTSYITARVVSNSINKHDNFIVLDRGIEDGVCERMAVITPTGEMLGYIAAASSRYSAALSVLSGSFTTSGMIEGGANYGSIRWTGDSRYGVSMSELSKYESINIGDKVVSTGFSQIFPRGVTIGSVTSFSLNEMQTAYNVELELAAQITAIDYVLIVAHRDQGEVNELLEQVDAR